MCENYILMICWVSKEFSKPITAMENDFPPQSSLHLGFVENHPFYHCLRPLLLFQKISGGWIHRPLGSTDKKCQYYAFQIYCIIVQLITAGALIRTVCIFNQELSMNAESMSIIMQVPLYVTIGIGQMLSYLKHRYILLFWDGMVHTFPPKFNSHIRRPKVIILVITITMVCLMFVRYSTEFYWIFKLEAESASMKLAEPWTGNVLEASVAHVATAVCFLPAFS